MKSAKQKLHRRTRRRRGIRKSVHGTSLRPRLAVFRSLKHIYAQLIDDDRGVTLCHASTRSKDLRDGIDYTSNTEAAKIVGASIAKQAEAANINQACFDRSGFRYHGRIKGLADAAREAGLSF